MKILVVLFALIGATFALVPGKEYVYQYEGRVGIGFPEIKNRVAGSGIRCKINLQVQSDENVAIKLEDVEVGEFMGDLGCHIREPMPIKYNPVDGDGKLLEDPYMIHLHRDQEDVMQVSKSDKEWITNIRKSIAGIFLVDPLRNNEPKAKHQSLTQMPYERISEPSIFGRCSHDYTLVTANETNSHKTDSNRNDTYAMTRSINFDSCDEVVGLQQTAFGNTTHARENQFQDVSSRISKVTANLTYDGSRFTIRDGVTEGYVSLNPFGLDQEKMISTNNQTYQLESIKDISSRWIINTPLKSVKTWHMESASPFTASESSPLWVNFYNQADDVYRPLVEEAIATGIQLSDDDIQKAKERINERLEESAQILTLVDHPPAKHNISPFDSESAVLVSHMESAFRAVRSLDRDTTQSLFDSYFTNSSRIAKLKYRLFVDSIGAAGTGGPLRVFVDESMKGRITPERAASVFFTLPNTLYSTPALPDLERYVKSLTLDKDPFATSTVWINYANLLNKVCLNERRYKYANPHELFGKKECDSKTRLDSVLTFFQDKLEKADEDWKRIILIQVIGNIGTVQAHSTLVNIVTDRSQSDTVRVTAVYGLSRNKLPSGVRDHVFQTLRPIVERRDEREYVRQACIIALLSWKPSPSFYQSLAIQSWKESSDNMASFIYFILRSYADSTDPAIDRASKASKFALPIAKPYARSYSFSDSNLYSKYTQQDELVTDFDVSWLKRDRSGKSFTQEVFAFLMNSYGGLRFSVAQGSISFNRESIDDLIRHMSQVLPQQYMNVRSSEHRRAQEALVDLQKRMSRQGKSGNNDFAIAFLSLFDDMELMLPLSQDPIMKALGKDGHKLFNEILRDRKFHGTKFVNPGPISLVLPSETGLPISVRFSVPTVNGGEANVTLTADGEDCKSISQLLKAKEIKLHVETNYRLASKQYTMLRVIMPWSERVAMAGVESLKAINLPTNISLSISRTNPQKNISLALIPRHFEEFPLFQVHTVPFVGLKSMWPGHNTPQMSNDNDDDDKDDSYKMLSINGNNQGTLYKERPINESYTGIRGSLTFEGDSANPFTMGNYIDLMKRPEEIPALFGAPSCRMFESLVKLDFGKSQTKEIHSSLSFYVKHRGEAELKRRTAFPDKLRDSSPDYEVETNLLFESERPRYFEASFSMKHSDESDKDITQFSFMHARNPIPNIDPNPKAHCVDVKRSAPKIRTVDDLRRRLSDSNDLETDYEGTLRGGVDCNQKNIGSFSGKVILSDERKDLLKKELDETCNSDPNNPMAHFTTNPVYDVATVEITYDEPLPRDILNQTYHFYDYMRGLAFPHDYFNYMDQQNQQGRISARGNRYIGERRWEVRATLPTETIRFDRFKMPKMFESIIPVGGLSDRRDNFDSASLVLDSQLSQDCVITKSKIRVFDGFSYNYPLDHCDTTAVIHKDDLFAPHAMVAVDSDTGKLKALIESVATGSTIVFNSKVMWFNNREVGLTNRPKVLRDDSTNKYIAEVLRTNSYVEVKIPGNFTLRLTDDQITIIPASDLRDKVGGLCGAFNGAVHRELIGKERCIYSDPKLFGYSWAQYVGPGCDYHTYQNEQKLVEDFRKSCNKIPDEDRDTSILPKFSKFPHDCLEYVYKVKKNGEAFCVTKDVVAMCYPLCKLDKPIYRQELYDCWPEVAAPKELLRNLKRGYIRHKITKRPEIFSAFQTEHAMICSRK